MSSKLGYGSRDFAPRDVLPAHLAAGVAPVIARYADRGLIFDDHTAYESRLLGSPEISQSAVDLIGVGGVVALTVAEFDFWNGDRSLDMMMRRGLAIGRPAVVKTTAAPTPWASDAGGDNLTAATIFKGVTAAMRPNGRRVRLALSDLSERLNVPLQNSRYDGLGGMGGTIELQGKSKPTSFGRRFNVTPVYVGEVDLGDGALPTYQTHSGAIAGHDAVRERGLAMTQVFATAPSVGQWRDWPAHGAFQLGFTPDGAITCDVRGDAAVSYSGSIRDVLARMLTGFGPMLDASDLHTTSWDVAAGQLGGEIGWGTGSEEISAIGAVGQILASCGAVIAGTRAGQLRLSAVIPKPGTVQMTLDEGDVVRLEPAALPAALMPTPQAIEIAGRRNWTVLSEINDSVAPEDRAAVSEAQRLARAASSSIEARQRLAKVMRLPGLYWLESDALRRALDLMAWIEPGLQMFNVTTDKYLGQVEVGHVAQLDYSYFGIPAGWLGTVLAWRERPNARRVTMTLIG